MALLPFSKGHKDEGPSVVDLLRQDHHTVKALFREFEAEEKPDAKQRIVQQALDELEVHASVEEKIFYPAVREDSPDVADKLDEALEEHHAARLLMHELRGMAPSDERFDAKFRVLAEMVKHHVKEEEAEMFARARTGDLDLHQLGQRLQAAKRSFASRHRQKEQPGKQARKAGRKVPGARLGTRPQKTGRRKAKRRPAA
ncbi:MAG TPA: hemerythrin domain-containing protein [Nitrospiraceae bacterium]|nr:hemerythrin domain-containing protein [Nitrospiraceae bacterium]